MGSFIGLIYYCYYDGGDTFMFFRDISYLTTCFWENPQLYLQFLFSSNSITHSFSNELFFAYEPRTFFFVRLLSVLNIFSLNNYWVLAMMMSALSFFGVIYFLDVISSQYKIGKIGIVCFLLFPSFHLWTSGVLKETFVISTLLAVVAILLNPLLSAQRKGMLYLFFCPLLYFCFIVKYYVTMPLLLFSGTYFIIKKRRNKAYQFVYLFGSLILGGFFIGFLHPNTSISGFFEAISNSRLLAGESEQFFNIETQNVLELPIVLASAAITGIFRPFVWEANSSLQIAQSIEKLLLLIAICYSIWKFLKNHDKVSLEMVTVTLYSVFLSTVFALSVPNIGSLSRYSVAFTPFLILVVIKSLENNEN